MSRDKPLNVQCWIYLFTTNGHIQTNLYGPEEIKSLLFTSSGKQTSSFLLFKEKGAKTNINQFDFFVQPMVSSYSTVKQQREIPFISKEVLLLPWGHPVSL